LAGQQEDDNDIAQWLQKKRRKSQQKDMWLQVMERGKRKKEERDRKLSEEIEGQKNLSNQLDELEMVQTRWPKVGHHFRREVSLVRGEVQNRMALVALSNSGKKNFKILA
jgi:hypothetical protein